MKKLFCVFEMPSETWEFYHELYYVLNILPENHAAIGGWAYSSPVYEDCRYWEKL